MESRRNHSAKFEQTIAAALSHEIHKAAQPLTVLQGLLELMLAGNSAGVRCVEVCGDRIQKTSCLPNYDECHALLKQVSEEVPRLARCFEEVRKIARLQSPTSDVDLFSPSALIGESLCELSGELYSAGISVTCEAKDDEPQTALVSASIGRVSTVVRSILESLIKTLCTGDGIRISIEGRDTNVEMSFAPVCRSSIEEQNGWLTTLMSRLKFAQLTCASIGGELRFTKAPVAVVVYLPLVSSPMGVQEAQRKTLYV